MKNCLHIRAGRIHLLVDAGHVLEVLELDPESADDGDQLHGCRLWRGSGIRTIDLRRLLDEHDLPPHGALVYSEDDSETPVLLKFDQVVGLIRAEEHSFRKLPRMAGKIAGLADSLLPDPASPRLLFHLKPGAIPA